MDTFHEFASLKEQLLAGISAEYPRLGPHFLHLRTDAKEFIGFIMIGQTFPRV